MVELTSLSCQACRAGAPKVAANEYAALLSQLPDWQIVQADNIDKLRKTFVFKNFKLAWQFSDKVCQLAEQEGHHPEILLTWGRVVVTWWTHAIAGLHQNDFICAAKTQALFTD